MVAIPKLDLFEYEPEPDHADGLAGDVGRLLSDEEVDQLLGPSVAVASWSVGRWPATIDADAPVDALASARGLTIGLALVLPVWCLILGALVL